MNKNETQTLADSAKKAEASEAKPVEAAEARQGKSKDKAKRARVRSLVGDMRHLLTDVPVTAVERMMEIDAFTQAQIDAGKWEIVKDE